MDKHTEQLDRTLKLLMGPDARLTGSAASRQQPGRFEIHVNRLTLGSGRTFQEALNQARRSAAQATIGER